MQKNIIILTSGLTGSSVLTGLLCRAGYWPGQSTHKKRDYDTYENEALVALNCKLLAEADYAGNYLLEYSQPVVDRIAALGGQIDETKYRAFVDTCDVHRPWIWKDPRLWLTIRFWSRLIDVDNCQFIVLTRSPVQTWVSAVSRRIIVSYGHSRRYEMSIEKSIHQFLSQAGARSVSIRYEDLIVRPAPTIERLNGYLNTKLNIEDLKAIYDKPLYKVPRSSAIDYIKAALIFLKNYDQRAGVTAGRE